MSYNELNHLLQLVKINKIPADVKSVMIDLIESQQLRDRFEMIQELPEKINKHTARLEQIIKEGNISIIEHDYLIDVFQDFVWSLKAVKPTEINFDHLMDSMAYKKEDSLFVDFPYSAINMKTEGLQQGLCIFAGASNIGKTAILHNLVGSWILHPRRDIMPDILYVSLDDTIQYTVARLITILSNIQTYKVSGRIQMSPKELEHVSSLKKALGEYHRKGKLHFCDQSNAGDSQSLELAIKVHCDRSKKPVVVIDGTYNLKMSRKGSYNLRQEAIELFNFLKEMADKYNIPILMTGEVPKDKTKADAKNPLALTDLLETGKAIYNAAYVFTCYPYNYEKFADTTTNSYILCVDLVKNKRSRGKGKTFFTVSRDCLKMKENEASEIVASVQSSDYDDL